MRGMIPNTIGDLAELTDLNLYNLPIHPKMTGPIPEGIGRLTKLEKT